MALDGLIKRGHMRTIYTLGYGQLFTPRLVEIVNGLDVKVIDVRGKPTSRRAGFGGRQLASLLGDRYRWMGDQLGGIYHLPNALKLWPDGVRKLLASEPRALLLCQCHAPGQCHRHMVSRVIKEIEPTARVVHLFEDESIEAGELARSISATEPYDCVKWREPSDLIAAWEA